MSADGCKEPLAFRLHEAIFFPMPTAPTKRRNVKSQALKLVRNLPAASSWDDLMYRIYVRQKIDAGLGDIEKGRTQSHTSLRKDFGLA